MNLMDKPNFQRDYTFYFENRKRFNFCGCEVPHIAEDPNGLSAMECFFIFDSRGKLKPCKEPKLFREIWICKKSINFHIKMWVQGYHDCMIGIPELLECMKNPPKWVKKALLRQLIRTDLNGQIHSSTPLPLIA